MLAVDERASTAPARRPGHLGGRRRAAPSRCPPAATSQLAGGTLASVDAETGAVWAARVDPVTGRVGRQRRRPPVRPRWTRSARVPPLAVSQAGTVVVTSAAERTVTYLVPREDGLREPRTEDLPERRRRADRRDRRRRAPSSRSTPRPGRSPCSAAAPPRVPEDSVLQQAGPAADAVLVATPRRPDERRPRQRRGHRPRRRASTASRPSPCASAPASTPRGPADWARVAVRVRRRRGHRRPTSGARASDLVVPGQPRRDRAQRRHHRRGVGHRRPRSRSRIDNWDAFTATTKDEDEDKRERGAERRRPPAARGRSPTARRPPRPHHRPAPARQRLRARRPAAQHRRGRRSPPAGPAPRSARTARPSSCPLPERRARHSFEYYIDDGRDTSAHATVDRRPSAAPATTAPRSRARAIKPRVWRVPAGGVAVGAGAAPTGATTRDGDPSSSTRRRAVGGDESGAVARTTSDGRVRFTAPRDGGEPVQVAYAVTDGRSAPVRRTMTFQVQDKLDQEAFAATRRARRRPRRGGPADQDPSPRSTTCPAPTRPTPTPSSRSAARLPGQGGADRQDRPRERRHHLHRVQGRHVLPRLRRGLRQRAPRRQHRSGSTCSRPAATATRSRCPTR